MTNIAMQDAINQPPPGWEREVPRYRATRDLQPPPKARHRSEPPFAATYDSSCWQYAERAIKAGEIIETKEWPHASFCALNYGATKVLEFFNTRMKSRLPRSPWAGDRLRLDDGLTGTAVVGVIPPRLEPMDLRAASQLGAAMCIARPVPGYKGLVETCRQRAEELAISRLELDRLAGLPSGYSAKLLGRDGSGPKQKRLWPIGLEVMLATLGLKILIIEDEAATARTLALREPVDALSLVAR